MEIISRKTPSLAQHLPILIGDLSLLLIANSDGIGGSKTFRMFAWMCGIISGLLSLSVCAWDMFLRGYEERSREISDSPSEVKKFLKLDSYLRTNFVSHYYNQSILSFIICVFGLSFAGLVVAIHFHVSMILPVVLVLGYIVKESVNITMNDSETKLGLKTIHYL